MALEKLDRGDRRLILACIVISVVSLFVGVRFYFLAFPEASIEFRVTRESSKPTAEGFLQSLSLDPRGYRHGAVFGFDDQQKTFLERELGVEEANKLLETTVRLWRWKHRWFRPLEKEEMSVEVTTKGEVVRFERLLPEDAPGADLADDDARRIAETFLKDTMRRPLDTLTFVEQTEEKRPHRTDHSYTWKVTGSEVHGADYRIGVAVAGDRVAGYSEYLKVPDTWIRDYETLRSANMTAGQIDAVFLLLTLLAMLVFLVLRIRRGDVRWKAALILGGVMFVLMTLSQLNSLPSALYDYDTTRSYAGFLLQQILVALAMGLGGGVVILLLSASGEPAYRQRFPRWLSLTSILRPKALRTREFFLSSLVGITLTFFFFAYENIFYIIANSLGAWAPRDVPYTDLLSTAFPWVFVLFFGFYPAISEEFISRMFSIPFFEKILRSTAAAVIVSAFIWGFGHAGYPNQPFWIRGLEVGLAGIAFGLVLLRFGIIAVVICHFSVDALYTAFVLIRSPNLYYRISGSLSAGVFVLMFLVAAWMYWRKGGFLAPEATNEAEGVAPEPAPAPAQQVAPPVVAYRPLPGRRIAWGLAVALGLLALRAIPLERFGDWFRVGATREDARETASQFLKGRGFDVSAYRSAVTIVDRTDPTAGAYLLQAGGPGVARKFYETLVPTPLWRVRFFVPLQKEEFWVSVDAGSAQVVGFSRTLLESAPGATLPKEQALAVAEAFLKERGVDPAAGEIKEQTEKDETARRDHTLVFEYAQPGAGEARVRQELVVQGDAVGSWTRDVKIPEEWRREREKETALTVILRWLKVPFLALLAGLAIALLIAKIRAGEIPWLWALGAGALCGAAALLRSVLALDAAWSLYSTSIPAGSYLTLLVVGVFLSMLAFLVGGIVVAGFAGALHPPAVGMLRRGTRALYARDAVVAGLILLCLVLAAPAVSGLCQALVPGGTRIAGVSWATGIDAKIPFLFVLANAATLTVFLAGLAGILAGVLRRFFPSAAWRALLAVVGVISFLPGTARTFPEHLAAALALAVLLALVIALVGLFFRDNPLAWPLGAWIGLGGAAAHRLALASSAYRLQGALALAGVVFLAAWVLLEARPQKR